MRTVAGTRSTELPGRVCTKCGEPKLARDFYAHASSKDGLHPHCKSCMSSAQARWQKDNPERYRQIRHERRVRVKRECMDAYGGVCACCGEARLFFLSIDHVNGDGAHDRKRRGAGNQIYEQLKREGYPQDGRYQVLCNNCNMAKGTSSTCPCRNSAPYLGQIQGQLALF